MSDHSFLSDLQSLRTARRFGPRDIDEQMLRSILLAAARAPSEFNLQPWRPVVCRTQEARVRLAACCLDQAQVNAAPVTVIIAASSRALIDDAPRAVAELVTHGHWRGKNQDKQLELIRGYYGASNERTRISALKNAMIFGHQLLLAGVSTGLDGFWLGGFDEARLRLEFGIPDEAVIAGVIGLGWPENSSESQRGLPRQSIEEIVFLEHWGQRFKDQAG